MPITSKTDSFSPLHNAVREIVFSSGYSHYGLVGSPHYLAVVLAIRAMTTHASKWQRKYYRGQENGSKCWCRLLFARAGAGRPLFSLMLSEVSASELTIWWHTNSSHRDLPPYCLPRIRPLCASSPRQTPIHRLSSTRSRVLPTAATPTPQLSPQPHSLSLFLSPSLIPSHSYAQHFERLPRVGSTAGVPEETTRD
jgi:hypothetical protein